MKIGIYEKDSGKLVYETEVVLLAGGSQTQQDAFNLAWKCGVDDNVVKDEDKDKYFVNKMAFL